MQPPGWGPLEKKNYLTVYKGSSSILNLMSNINIYKVAICLHIKYIVVSECFLQFGVHGAPSDHLKISLPISFSIFLRMQPRFPPTSRKWGVLNAPGCHTRIRLKDYTRASSLFLLEPFQWLKQMRTPPHAPRTQTQRQKGGGWTTPSLEEPSSPPLSHKHTCAHTCTFSWLHHVILGKPNMGVACLGWNHVTELVRELAVAKPWQRLWLFMFVRESSVEREGKKTISTKSGVKIRHDL